MNNTTSFDNKHFRDTYPLISQSEIDKLYKKIKTEKALRLKAEEQRDCLIKAFQYIGRKVCLDTGIISLDEKAGRE
tara:strand:- start:283 stop:510 length:228 start_codon:yes stop_codon:yes gene_type:complete